MDDVQHFSLFLCLVFEESCHYFRGPHSIECLEDMWLAVGCTDDGFDHPRNSTYLELELMSLMTLV